jgi:hypothetical protein
MFPAFLPAATIAVVVAAKEQPGSRLTARVPALPLLLLLAAIAAPAQARSEPENYAGEKPAQTTESLLSPKPQLLELQQENAAARWYDTSGDSFTEKERSDATPEKQALELSILLRLTVVQPSPQTGLQPWLPTRKSSIAVLSPRLFFEMSPRGSLVKRSALPSLHVGVG